jgi:hypothetical protein
MKGRCVICGHLGPLTRDHVPPKGVTPPHPIEVSRLTAILGGQEGTDRPHRRYQSPDFPSLCSECNTNRLGYLYDPHLVSFAGGLATWVRGAFDIGLTLPATAPVKIRPQAVARAVVGHLLAAEERSNASNPLSKGTLVRGMRDYFLGGKVTSAPGFQIYVWPYNGIELVIIRGFAMARVLGRRHGPVVGDILKFFPVAFWVVAEQASDVEIQFASLDLSNDEETIIDIPLRCVPPWGWPERPRDDEIVVVSGDRTHISRRTKSGHRAT